MHSKHANPLFLFRGQMRRLQAEIDALHHTAREREEAEREKERGWQAARDDAETRRLDEVHNLTEARLAADTVLPLFIRFCLFNLHAVF